MVRKNEGAIWRGAAQQISKATLIWGGRNIGPVRVGDTARRKRSVLGC